MIALPVGETAVTSICDQTKSSLCSLRVIVDHTLAYRAVVFSGVRAHWRLNETVANCHGSDLDRLE